MAGQGRAQGGLGWVAPNAEQIWALATLALPCLTLGLRREARRPGQNRAGWAPKSESCEFDAKSPKSQKDARPDRR